MTALTDRWTTHPKHFWLRGEEPEEAVRFDEATGTWQVYSYQLAQHVLTDPATFSSTTTRLLPEAQQFQEGDLTQLDPPRHDQLRKLVNQAFTPRVVAGLEPRVEQVANELLDAAGSERIDLVEQFAYPLPVIVIAELLGVPREDREQFRVWVDKMLSSSSEFSVRERTPEQEETARESMRQAERMTEYFREHAAQRRRSPGEDLLTKLVEAEVDGERLGDAEVVNFATLLLLAGHITTTMLVGNTVLCLDAHPQERSRVRADRSLVPSLLEESLRMFTPFPVMARITNIETELGGKTIPADQLVMVWLAAANRDPEKFADPHAFDPARDPNPHLAFGRGIHFCLGAPLARLEGRVATNLLLDRYPNLRCDPQDQPTFLPTPNLTGTNRLPLLLS